MKIWLEDCDKKLVVITEYCPNDERY
ncbi:hypothetical protein LCGC14_2316760, partial [marine sediment metagenome]